MTRPCPRSPREHHWYGPQTVPFGASNHQQPTHPPTDAAALADLVLQDQDGNDVRLGDLWAQKPVVLAWLRHYG